MANDSIKNNFCEINGTPLLRFTAAEVRENIAEVVVKILDTTSELDGKKRDFTDDIPEFKTDEEYWEDLRKKHCEATRRRKSGASS